jgi:hypothetical protein
VAEFARVSKSLDDAAAAIASGSDASRLPGPAVRTLTEIGEAAGAVLHAAEPKGEAGAAALQEALADAADDVVRHLATAAGGQEQGHGRVVLSPPAMVAFDTDTKTPPPEQDRSSRGMAAAHESLLAGLTREMEHFVYVALLANPRTRATLAPHLSPDDLPPEVPDLNLSVATRDEWRVQLFDDQNRLVVPSSYDPLRWKSFLAWAETVNPAIRNAVSDLTRPAFRLVR